MPKSGNFSPAFLGSLTPATTFDMFGKKKTTEKKTSSTRNSSKKTAAKKTSTKTTKSVSKTQTQDLAEYIRPCFPPGF